MLIAFPGRQSGSAPRRSGVSANRTPTTRKVGRPSRPSLAAPRPPRAGGTVSARTGQRSSRTRTNGRSAPPGGGGTRGEGRLLALSLQSAAGLTAATSETETNPSHPRCGRSPRPRHTRGPGRVAPRARMAQRAGARAADPPRGGTTQRPRPAQAPGEAPCTRGLCHPTPLPETLGVGRFPEFRPLRVLEK